MTGKEKEFYDQIMWFGQKKKYDVDFFEYFQPQRLVRRNGRYNSGTFYSEKCQRMIQYESGIELDFIRKLEQLEIVEYYFEQPVRIPYWRSKLKKTYTPDFGVFLKTNEFILVEIKDLPGMLENKVQMKIEGLLAFCYAKGFGLLLTDGKNTFEKINRFKINKELETEILQITAYTTLRKKEWNELMKKHNATNNELMKIVTRNNLKYNSFPFQVKTGNKNHVFRQVFIEKKKYENLITDRLRRYISGIDSV